MIQVSLEALRTTLMYIIRKKKVYWQEFYA